MSAAGENFEVSEFLQEKYPLQNERRRRKFLRFESATKGILPYKWAPQAKILRFVGATKGILPYIMSAAGENFGVWREKIETPHIRFEIQNLEILKPDVDKNRNSA